MGIKTEERAFRVIMVCKVGTGLGTILGLRKVHVFIHLSSQHLLSFLPDTEFEEEVEDLRGRRVKRGSLGGFR